MPQIVSQFERARQLISEPPEKRMDHEINQLVPWLRSKAKLFKQLKSELLADIMRNCNIETKKHDDVIIKQGDTGECFYIVLSGKVSIYILNKEDSEGSEEDGVGNIIVYNDKGKLDRDKLGYMVTHLGTGAPFGEVALMSDSVRTASIIAEEPTDLLVVDRKLYNRSIKEVLAKEFQEKTNFIANNPLFRNWPPKYRKQLAMALYKESFGYESPLVRQGDRTDEMYFILSGQVEIQVDPSTHPHQYPRIFKAAKENEVEKLIKKAANQRQVKHSKGRKKGDNSNTSGGVEPHIPNQPIKRRDTTKCTRLCHLGVNETVGDLELTLDLPTYMQSAICTETTSVLVLEHRHYVRLFIRRHPRTIDKMREEIGVKLDSRLSLLSLKQEIPFLQYVRQIIASQNLPPPTTDTDQETHTVFTAEKDFLNHKGPLIDLFGPGSVFFLINKREEKKMRLKAKRGGPSDRQMLQNARGRTKSYRDMQLLAQLVEASRDENSLGESSTDDNNGEDVEIPGDYHSENVQTSSSEEQPTEVEANLVNGEQVSASHGSNHHQNHHLQHLGKWKSPSLSPEQLSPRPGTGWMSQLRDAPEENAEVQDATLSTLEARLRHFLETGNPKHRPQVAQLRRLPVQDTEFQPKPGNKVVVRKKGASPRSTPANIMARVISRSQHPALDNNTHPGTQRSRLDPV